jgi:hypothetical protein
MKQPMQQLVPSNRRLNSLEAKMTWQVLSDVTVAATAVGVGLMTAVLLALPFFLALATLFTAIYNM